MHPHHHGHHWPYDPVHHHHPKHPPYMVDRCAEECDDQLPLFSQVGRGLQGDGYRVEVAKDSLTETILEGLVYDAHTGALTSDWFSENINGGHLSYQYNLRPFTDPQTFTITFKYVRPGRNADENGTVWSWTTPAIPYLWSRQPGGSMSDGEDIVGTGVATLYLKKTTDGAWNWRQHEKLIYPDGFTHEDMNAPDPLEGWTVNLTYGIGGDIDAPNIDDLAKVLGITVNNIRNIIQNSPVPTETIPDQNLKKYIDRRDGEVQTAAINAAKTYTNQSIDNINVVSKNERLLTVAKVNDQSKQPRQLKFELTPKKYIAGMGIKINEITDRTQGESYQIVNNIASGPGIQLQYDEDEKSITIINAQVGGQFITLRPGIDFDWDVHNWFYFGPNARSAEAYPPSGKTYEIPQSPNCQHPNKKEYNDPFELKGCPRSNPPRVRVAVSRDPDGSISSATLRIDNNFGISGVGYGPADSVLFCTRNFIEQVSVFQWGRVVNQAAGTIAYPDAPQKNAWAVDFKHGEQWFNMPTSSVFSIKFIGAYEDLNDMWVASLNANDQIWNVSGRLTTDMTSEAEAWQVLGASWPPVWQVTKLPVDDSGWVDGDVGNIAQTTYPKKLNRDAVGRKYNTFLFQIASISDGFNNSYFTPRYTLRQGANAGTIAAALGSHNQLNLGLTLTMAK